MICSNCNMNNNDDSLICKKCGKRLSSIIDIKFKTNKDNTLLKELYRLRDELKRIGRITEARTPTVCTDYSLIKMEELKPMKIADFATIPDLGAKFIDKYAKYFLEVIKEYTVTDKIKVKNISKNNLNTLKELQKKLVNVNKRNRLLYLPKLSKSHSYDLYNDKYNPLEIIFNKKTIKICDINETNTEKELDRYKKLVALIREVNKDVRENGQFDLYIGYPFIKGRITGENFDIRAPLTLFPIEVIREATYIAIKLDETRDIIYNNDIVLAHLKFNNINKPLPNNVIEEINNNTYIDKILEYYANEDINIINKQANLQKFIEYRSEEFPQFKCGELYLEQNIVLGKFSTYSTSLQKDFNDIIQKNEINELLSDLLMGIEDEDFYSDSYAGEIKIKNEEKGFEISEKDLTYINDLNSSQEQVLTAINKLDELVVQGPPGTGKSQTITSLITDFVNKNKTVIMVSEKKSALDVVYSRLGELSKYALLIDDTNNKELFYKQIEKMFNPKVYNEQQEMINIEKESEAIDNSVRRLEMIAQKLYSTNEFGIEIYKLYLQNKKIQINDQFERINYKIFKDNINIEILKLKYFELMELNKKFNNKKLLDSLIEYKMYIDNYSFADKIKDSITEYEILELKDNINNIKIDIEEYNKKNLIEKILLKSKLNSKIIPILDYYFIDSKKENLKIIYRNYNLIIECLNNYQSYVNNKTVYDTLSTIEKEYFNSIYNINNALNKNNTRINDELYIINNDIYNFIIYEFLQRFEVENRELLKDIADFNNIIEQLAESIKSKKNLTRKKIEKVLLDNINNFKLSKRGSEISRIIESKRKWSVSRFIKKFDFEVFKGIKIWLLTPEVVSEIIPLEFGMFDLLIFDEASQMYVEKGLPSVIRAKKVIIAGDSKQLRPSNLGVGRIDIDEDLYEEDEERAAALEEESLLDLARFKYTPLLLNFHYRSKYEELIAFSNYAFYKGKLYVSPNANQSEKPPIEVIKLENAIWINRSNREEARKVLELLKIFFEERKNNETIGVITFNSNQRDLILDLIDEECAKNPEFYSIINTELQRKENGEDIGLFIKNIENVQGDERDVIMFSIGYAKNENGKLIRSFGWLNQKGGENRLNVAISRAKQKIYIITSIVPSELQIEDCKNEGPKYLKKYLEYAFAVSTGNRDLAKQILLSFGDSEDSKENIIFDSDFEMQVYDELVKKGYKVETQIGIGGYSIDLAIRENDKYILGIECDGKLYHSSKSARERDYHRQKYLETRGWKIHRIWSTNWWRNPQREIDKIVHIIETFKMG